MFAAINCQTVVENAEAKFPTAAERQSVIRRMPSLFLPRC
jgi:hypothetical protein